MREELAARVLATLHAPGWNFYVDHPDDSGRALVHVAQSVPDAHDPERVWTHDEHFWLDKVDNAFDLIVECYTRSQFRVVHEHAHQFRVGGEAVFDQHHRPESISKARDVIERRRALL